MVTGCRRKAHESDFVDLSGAPRRVPSRLLEARCANAALHDENLTFSTARRRCRRSQYRERTLPPARACMMTERAPGETFTSARDAKSAVHIGRYFHHSDGGDTSLFVLFFIFVPCALKPLMGWGYGKHPHFTSRLLFLRSSGEDFHWPTLKGATKSALGWLHGSPSMAAQRAECPGNAHSPF